MENATNPQLRVADPPGTQILVRTVGQKSARAPFLPADGDHAVPNVVQAAPVKGLRLAIEGLRFEPRILGWSYRSSRRSWKSLCAWNPGMVLCKCLRSDRSRHGSNLRKRSRSERSEPSGGLQSTRWRLW
jgi:hypothetical protein